MKYILGGGVLMLTAASAQALELGMPVDCIVGEECFIQNYVDHARAKGAISDYLCGALTYDGHNGTDFRVGNYADMAEGVNVLATADGTVSDLRHYAPIEEGDSLVVRIVKSGSDSDCGASLRIDHNTGWQSIYCHLDNDGFTVKKGDIVTAGQVIGKMGATGKSIFPHVHYELRHYNVPVDPFVGYSVQKYNCDTTRRDSQWTAAAAKELRYVDMGLVTAGFSAMPPTPLHARYEKHSEYALPSSAPSLYFWAELYGLREYDVLKMRFIAPDGTVLAKKTVRYDEYLSLSFETLSAQRGQKAEAWETGIYTVEAEVTRYINLIGQTVFDHVWQIEVVEK